MIEVESEKIYYEPNEYTFNVIDEDEKNRRKKEKWIISVKEGLLKDKNKSLDEIDESINILYDNLNEEYRNAIVKNPELILYYLLGNVEKEKKGKKLSR